MTVLPTIGLKNSRTSTNSGFSLTELMIVVAVIGVLAIIGRSHFSKMVLRAKRAEAGVNLRTVYMTIKNVMEETQSNPGYGGINVISNDFSTLDSCYLHPSNNLEIKFGDCRKLRYSIAVITATAPLSIEAYERRDGTERRLFPGCAPLTEPDPFGFPFSSRLMFDTWTVEPTHGKLFNLTQAQRNSWSGPSSERFAALRSHNALSQCP